MKTIQATLAAAWLTASLALAVPSEINYQGVLTDSQGNLVNGNQTMSLKIYDSSTGGTLLYSENLGTVPVNNGVYNFTFGANGTSNALTTETVATTNGTSTSFQKVLTASSVVAGSVSVSDGTYTWDQMNGSSNENEFGVAYSTALRRVTATYYNGAPAAGRTITATYRAPVSGISGALDGNSQPWVDITVNGTNQTPRQKLLTVPFALRAIQSEVKSASQSSRLSEEIMNLTNAVTQTCGVTYSGISSRLNSTGTAIGLVTSLTNRWIYGGGELVGVDYGSAGKLILGSTIFFTQQYRNHNGYIKYTYTDSTTSEKTWSGFIDNGVVSYANPYPEKKVRYINATAIAQGGNDGPFANMNGFSAFTLEEASISFTANLIAKKIFVNPQAEQSSFTKTFLSIHLQDGSKIEGQWNQWLDLTNVSSISTITIGGTLKNASNLDLQSIKIISTK
jgi:hypothetical protein